MRIIRDVEQGSDAWLQLRKGKITGTRLSAVMSQGRGDHPSTLQQSLIAELIAERVSLIEALAPTYAMERGHETEAHVREEYIPLGFEQVSFIEVSSISGISPDLVRFEGEDIVEAIEVKAPNPKKFVKFMIEHRQGEFPQEYYWQCVHYFVCIPSLQKLTLLLANNDALHESFMRYPIVIQRENIADDIERATLAIEQFMEYYVDQFQMLTQ